MKGPTDMVGRIEQAIGALTGNENLERLGRADERRGRINKQADDAVGAVRDTLEDVAETRRPKESE